MAKDFFIKYKYLVYASLCAFFGMFMLHKGVHYSIMPYLVFAISFALIGLFFDSKTSDKNKKKLLKNIFYAVSVATALYGFVKFILI